MPYHSFSNSHVCCSLTNQIIALKEIRLQEEEGAPFTAIREGKEHIARCHLILRKRSGLECVGSPVCSDMRGCAELMFCVLMELEQLT